MSFPLAPHLPGLGEDLLDVFEHNDTNMTTTVPVPIITTPSTPIEQPHCQWIRYEEIANSRVRIWDLIILVPNALFLLFLLVKFRVAIVKLNRTSSPIFMAFYVLVLTAAIISVLRCVVSMTVNAAVPAGDHADRILWLVLRFFLLATELSVVIFSLAFGHLDSRTSIKRVLLVTFSMALIYSTTQGVLEFIYPNDKFHIKHDNQEYNIFGHGGMLFWFASSVFFFLVYSVICVMPFTVCRERFAMPSRVSFYVYCLLLAVLNALQATGSGLLFYEISHGMCLVDVTSYIYFTCFAPLVYGTYLFEFFRTSQPPDILFSYKAQTDEDEDTLHLPHTAAHGIYHSETDPMAGSYDSTHFDTNSPNPLYGPEFHFYPELRINSHYFRDDGVVGGGDDDDDDDEVLPVV